MYPQLSLDEAKGPKVKLATTAGDIVLQLFPEQAPKTVESFTTLAKSGYYDGTIFHRVISDFMLQGGDPTGTGMGGESIWKEPFEDEFSKELYNIRGALSMANAGPNTNGSQFFIVQSKAMTDTMLEQMTDAGFPEEIVAKYKEGGTPWLDFRHTVFGQVVEGMDVVDKIAMSKTDEMDKPLKEVVIETATVL
ncbi:peptidyl-prolyl cis-trans isomerase [Secundilactobacillus oryzae JCM 18671]|uniref:Peptidyl-prolyl cis-trans isomerase n=1 Tax=Secundilactobacillus oryzae JCM 18671 TaxID=1291743 RepID=A0A081BIY2_9LACO|nr:peptidylprolyl isomerase [Secundilactobacillus oryzae]GAK48000.1 peptidyl-prolyl cis-trans isomerase [Secundilactobacillus oryzae JCM 18671]